ncbi:CgeB family protein [Carboxylicivirga sp. N1Y90]|uniref:CgeB family protein n=1 Tax=Carboxylicivirga fragile TaxID=3417571 RepID=UPI003D340E53|nr:glycosyltransferase [Marinilabiliaceae bacterium N1Y90]
MKIIIPNHRPADSFVDNVAHTLEKMGHQVLTMPNISNRLINSPIYRYTNEFIKKANPNQLDNREKWLLKNAKEYKPDILFTLTQAIKEDVLFQVKKSGVRHCIAWWGDTPANMRDFGLLSSQWDLIYIKDLNAVNKFKRLRLNAHLMHEAMNPTWHKPLIKKKNNRISVAGTFYGYRQHLVSKLLNEGIEMELNGGRLPRWVLPEIKLIHQQKFIVREEKSKVFGEALACLNSTDLSEGNSLNCRAFEIAGAGGLQLLEYRSIVTECFEPGKEILTFDTFGELLELITRIKKDNKWANQISIAGHKRALNEHTYEHRLNKIFKDRQQL